MRLAVAMEHRTVANFIEVLVSDYCHRHGMAAAPSISKKQKNR